MRVVFGNEGAVMAGSSFVRFTTYNLLDVGWQQSERDRWSQVAAVIADLDADVVAVQEVRTEPGGHDAMVRWLAAECGMRCELPDGSVAVEPGSAGFGVALLWSDRVRPVPDRVRRVRLFHGLIVADFHVPTTDDGDEQVVVAHAAVHGPPFGRNARVDEAERVAGVLTRWGTAAVVVGGDWNGVGADHGRDGRFYDHDPYAEMREWLPDLIYQTDRVHDDRGRLVSWSANRDAALTLRDGGLVDAAAALDRVMPAGLEWQATTGHWAGDPFPPRRIDAARTTAAMVPALRAVAVHRVPGRSGVDPTTVSDHLPVILDYAPAVLDGAGVAR